MPKESLLAACVVAAICTGPASLAWGKDMAPDPEKHSGASIQVSVNGSDDIRYAAAWTVTAESGEQEQFETSGEAPAVHMYRGVAISGTVTVLSPTGRLEVEILKNGNRSRSSTQGGGSVVRMTVR